MIEFNLDDYFMKDIKTIVEQKLTQKSKGLKDFDLYVWGVNKEKQEDMAVSNSQLKFGLDRFIINKKIVVRNPTDNRYSIGLSYKLREKTELAANIIIFAAILENQLKTSGRK